MIHINLAVCAILIVFAGIQTAGIKSLKQEYNEEKSLIAGLIHDLKNPLNAQINILNLLQKGHFGELEKSQREMINLTSHSCRYMSNLIYTILFSYKSDTGKILPSPEVFDLAELICEVCKEYKYCAEDNNQAFILNFPNEGCYTCADRVQIKRVIYNLISNAVTYGLKNSYISADIVKIKNIIEVTVNNKSAPIDKSELKNIFKKFSTCGNSRHNRSSIGLGLYNSERIIRLNHGVISAKYTKDGIISFSFRLPAAKNIPDKTASEYTLQTNETN